MIDKVQSFTLRRTIERHPRVRVLFHASVYSAPLICSFSSISSSHYQWEYSLHQQYSVPRLKLRYLSVRIPLLTFLFRRVGSGPSVGPGPPPQPGAIMHYMLYLSSTVIVFLLVHLVEPWPKRIEFLNHGPRFFWGHDNCLLLVCNCDCDLSALLSSSGQVPRAQTCSRDRMV